MQPRARKTGNGCLYRSGGVPWLGLPIPYAIVCVCFAGINKRHAIWLGATRTYSANYVGIQPECKARCEEIACARGCRPECRGEGGHACGWNRT